MKKKTLQIETSKNSYPVIPIIPKENNSQNQAISKKKKFKEKFKSITFDNGSEFRDYKGLERSYDKRKKEPRVAVYYAHPYRSGERGSNENNNRLIRRFIPKGVDITPISEEYIQSIEDWMNNLLRPMFGYKSSKQVA